MICPNCKKEVEFGHYHACAHGIAKTHMAGTENYTCPECKKAYYKHDGEQLGFKYYLD